MDLTPNISFQTNFLPTILHFNSAICDNVVSVRFYVIQGPETPGQDNAMNDPQ